MHSVSIRVLVLRIYSATLAVGNHAQMRCTDGRLPGARDPARNDANALRADEHADRNVIASMAAWLAESSWPRMFCLTVSNRPRWLKRDGRAEGDIARSESLNRERR